MDLDEFKTYLINHEGIYPEYCKKEKRKYKNCNIYSPQFNGKAIGLPIFYLVKEDKIRKCTQEEMYEILDLLQGRKRSEKR